jgi:hypothetical protein
MDSEELGLEIADGSNERVTITLVERGTGQATGDVRLRVAVASIGFEGESDSVWIEGQVAAAFLDRLAAVDRKRRGSATLTSMSPVDFSLQIKITDSAGHAVASGFLARSCGSVEARLGFEFGLEPDRLPHVLRDARRILIEHSG